MQNTSSADNAFTPLQGCHQVFAAL